MNKKMQVEAAVANGDYVKAVKIAKNFNIELTKEENAIVRRAHEMQKNASFYEQLGFNKEEQMQMAIEILKSKYGVNEDECNNS